MIAWRLGRSPFWLTTCCLHVAGRLLPCLRLVRSSTVELLFFKETLGDVSIARVLQDIYAGDKQHTIES